MTQRFSVCEVSRGSDYRFLAFLMGCLAASWIGLRSIGAAEPPNSIAAEEDLEQLSAELDAADAESACDTPCPDAESTAAAADTVEVEARADDMEDQQSRRGIEQRKRLQADPRWKPTHSQVDRLVVGQTLNNFCLDKQGRILACCPDNRIRIVSQQGKELDAWELEFSPQAIGVCQQDGTVFVGGEGQLARLSPKGKVLQSVTFPRPMTDKEKEELIRAQIESQLGMFDKYRKGISQQLTVARDELTDEQKAELDKMEPDNAMEELQKLADCVTGTETSDDCIRLLFKDDTEAYKQARLLVCYTHLLEQQFGTRKDMEQQVRDRFRQSAGTSNFTGVAVAEKDLFVVCSAPGYSYNAWRLTHDLQDAQLIVKGLSGCCGQMDCQTDGRDLWIPVNGEHLVYHYDRDGNVVSKFGKNDQEAADGFGGCCEPKNVRFSKDGYVYCAQSGPPVCVKRFSTDGTFQDVVCFPIYETGCVRASVDMAGDKVFLLSPNEGAIYVFAKK